MSDVLEEIQGEGILEEEADCHVACARLGTGCGGRGEDTGDQSALP